MIQDLIEQGLQQHNAGRLLEAKSLYEQALAINPRQPDALHLLGLAALQSGAPEQAVMLIRQAVDLQPRNWAFRGNLAMAFFELRRFEEAQATFKQASKLRPDEPQLEMGIANCVTGLKRVKKIAEDHGVTICVELLNSKVNHPDYQGDRTAFGAAVVKAVGSPRVKLLYDIYHMQIMEGDLIKTIRDHHDSIGHYHTGGVPGRHELDETQEVNWPAVCRAIVDTGFSGYLAHEFVPTRDPLTSLRQAVALCDV